MKNGKIYFMKFSSFLTCLDAKTGKVNCRKSRENNPEFFETVGPYLSRQSWRWNLRTRLYLMCSDKAVYLAGPQVGKLLALSADDGNILWENPYDNFQLILRYDGLYGISGSWYTRISKKFDPMTGQVLGEIDVGRRCCARITGTADAIMLRALG
jgi:outer membrane protein assembly factor BamB